MKGKYLTTSVLLACLAIPTKQKKDIYAQLNETIAEHRKIMREFKSMSKKQYDLFVKIDKEAA